VLGGRAGTGNEKQLAGKQDGVQTPQVRSGQTQQNSV